MKRFYLLFDVKGGKFSSRATKRRSERVRGCVAKRGFQKIRLGEEEMGLQREKGKNPLNRVIYTKLYNNYECYRLYKGRGRTPRA